MIARALVLSEKTVKTHVSSRLAKLGSDAPAAGDNLRAFACERSDLSEIHMMQPCSKMGEDEGGAGDVADLAGADGDALEGAPAAGEQPNPRSPR